MKRNCIAYTIIRCSRYAMRPVYRHNTFARRAFTSGAYDIIIYEVVFILYYYINRIISRSSLWWIFDSNFCGAQQWTANGRSRTRLGNPTPCTCNIILRTLLRSLFLHDRCRSRHFEEGADVFGRSLGGGRRARKLIRFKIMIMKTSRHDGCHRTRCGHTTDVSGDNTPRGRPISGAIQKRFHPKWIRTTAARWRFLQMYYTRYDRGCFGVVTS